VSSGWIYALINPAYPDVLKIGMTEKEPNARMRELCATGVLHPFALVHVERVSDALAAEALCTSTSVLAAQQRGGAKT
jgi:hypothetical protein